MKQTEIFTNASHVNGWESAGYMSCMSQNFCLFHVSNVSVRNFRIVLLMYPGPVSGCRCGVTADGGGGGHRRRGGGGEGDGTGLTEEDPVRRAAAEPSPLVHLIRLSVAISSVQHCFKLHGTQVENPID